MGEIIPFDTTREPFVRIEPDREEHTVTFENCPRLRGLSKSFPDAWGALRYGMGFAIGEGIPMLWKPVPFERPTGYEP